MRDTIIYGAGGHGKVVLEILGVNTVGCFMDNDSDMWGKEINGVPIGQPLKTIDPYYRVLVAIGDNEQRLELAENFKPGLTCAFSRTAISASTAKFGVNVVLCHGAIIGDNAWVQDSVILNTGCIVDHECVIGEGAHVCPGAQLAGRVNVGRGALIGTGATVLPNTRIGPRVIVGAGAVVTKEVRPGSTVVGCPAREIRHE